MSGSESRSLRACLKLCLDAMQHHWDAGTRDSWDGYTDAMEAAREALAQSSEISSRDSIIEECVNAALEFVYSPNCQTTQAQTARAVADAIRALKNAAPEDEL